MGFWSKFGGALKKVAPIAAAFIPGVGPVASTLIGAGIGAASNANKGLKGMAIGAGVGAGSAFGADKLGGIMTKLGGPNLTNAATQQGAGAGTEVVKKSLGGKLMDSLTSPEILKAGIGAGLQGVFGDDGQERTGFKGRGDPQRLMEQLVAALSAGGQAQIDLMNQPFRTPTVAPINFNANIEGLPFKLGLNNPGIQGRESAAPSASLDELKKILAGM